MKSIDNVLTANLEKDDAFMNELASAKNDEEIRNVFEKKGIAVSIEDIRTARSLENCNDELSADALEAVSGGVIKGPIYWIGWLLGRAVTKGVCK